MSTVFGTIAAVLLAAAAFVAFKNKGAYEAEIATNKSALQLKVSTEKELAKEQARLVAAEADRDKNLAAAKDVQAEFDEVTALFESAKKEVDTLSAEHKANEAKIANADDTLKGLPDPDELVPKVKRMQSDLSAAQSEIATYETSLANLLQRSKNAEERVSAVRKLIDLQSSGKSFPSLRTSISSVYRNWGFVILSAGDSQGVVTDSRLDVLRGGEVIGKLQVTAVEAGRAAADIVLDSVADGTTLQIGDTVVAESEAAKPEATAAVAQ